MKVLIEQFPEYWRNNIGKLTNSYMQLSLLLAAILLVVAPVHASIIGADGGITLWVSYDNLDALGASVDENVTQDDGVSPGTCSATNNARAAQGAPDSPGSCSGGDTCSGRDKLLGDIDQLAEYIYTSTHGTHYLRRAYVADQGRAWTTADIKWNIGSGGSSAWPAGWKNVDLPLNLNSSTRRCIHDVLHHELGHYLYELPDRYASSGGYYSGSLDGGATTFDVAVDEGDPNSVMAGNFPHLFVDTTNARLVLSYDQPGPASTTGEVLTPALLTDADPNNDGPDRTHHGFTTPFAQDEWSVLPSAHGDLAGVHTEGDFNAPTLLGMPDVDVRFLGDDEPFPGTVLLLDRSGSMGVQTNGRPASSYVQEAGLYLYHSSEDDDYVGTFLYNHAVEQLFDYDVYDSTNLLPNASFRNATGATNIALALEEAIDAMIAEHGEEGVNSGQIILMSDGKQTTGDSLWDQVNRANDLGIKINTMTFGNADATTMEEIATDTGGSPTPMSELDSGAELKLNMTRKMTTLRGNSAVYTYKGKVKKTSEEQQREYFSSQFYVPPRTKDMLFYVFLEKNNAADLNIQLTDESGNHIQVPANNLARNGRFNGIRVKAAHPGKWTFKIFAGRRLKYRMPTSDNIEVVAYVANREMNAQMWFDKDHEDYPDRRVIKARLDFRYPLTNLLVNARVYDGAKLIQTLPMFDNGEKGRDTEVQDGIYSGVLDMKSLNLSDFKQTKRPRKIRIDVEYVSTNQTVPAPSAHYETGTNYDDLLKEYEKRFGRKPFTAYATATTHVHPGKSPRPSMDVVYGGKTLVVKPGGKGVIKVKVQHARPLLNQLRVSLGQGVTAKATSILSDVQGAGVSIIVKYKVAPNAQPGKRALSFQFGKTRLDQENAMVINNYNGKKAIVPKRPLKLGGAISDHAHPHIGRFPSLR